MRNRYSDTCYRCGETCAVGDGHFERHRGNWAVQHAACAIEFRGTSKGKEAQWQHEIDTVTRREQERAKGTGKSARAARRILRAKGLLPQVETDA